MLVQGTLCLRMILVLILAEIKLKSFIECSNIIKLQNRISIRSPVQASQNKHMECGMWYDFSSPKYFYSHSRVHVNRISNSI